MNTGRPDVPARRPQAPEMGAGYGALARQDTDPEIRLRKEWHSGGMRYRVDYRVPGLPRHRMDIAFTRARLVVLVDGCFWHHFPAHRGTPVAAVRGSRGARQRARGSVTPYG